MLFKRNILVLFFLAALAFSISFADSSDASLKTYSTSSEYSELANYNLWLSEQTSVSSETVRSDYNNQLDNEFNEANTNLVSAYKYDIKVLKKQLKKQLKKSKKKLAKKYKKAKKTKEK